MPRENSFSDSDGRSLTPDLEEELGREGNNGLLVSTGSGPPPAPTSPVKSHTHKVTNPLSPIRTRRSSAAPHLWTKLPPKEKFRALVRTVIFVNRGRSALPTAGGGIGAEPGIDPRRDSAELLYGHIHQECTVEIMDYSAVRSSVGRMTNAEFVDLMQNPIASAAEPWVKVRWINIGGVSWEVMKAVSIKYGLFNHIFQRYSNDLIDLPSLQTYTPLLSKIYFMYAVKAVQRRTIT